MPQERRKATLPILFSIIVIDLVGFGIIVPILPFYADAFGASGLELGIVLSGYAAMQFVAAPWWGRLSDRIGRRPVMLVTVAGTAASLYALGIADSLVGLLVARLLAGVFGANISVATAYIADVTNEDERTRWMGMVGASFGVGFLLGPAIGGLLAPRGYGVPMLVAAAMAACNFLFAVAVLREPDVHRPREGAGGGRIQVLRDPFIRRICLIFLFFSIGVTQMESIFAYLMKYRFGYDAREVAYILVFVALIMTAIQGGAMRHLAARFGEKRLLLVGSGAMSLCFVAIPISPTIAIMLLPLALLGIGRAISHPPMLSMVSLAATPTNRGIVMGTFQSAGHLARVVGPLAAGALWDFRHSSPFLLASVALAGVCALAWTLPESSVAAKPGNGESVEKPGV